MTSSITTAVEGDDSLVYLGKFVGHDKNKYHASAKFEATDNLLRIRVVNYFTEKSFPIPVLHGLRVLDAIEYPDYVKKIWSAFLDNTGRTWKLGNAQKGRRARLKELKRRWLAKNEDPRHGLGGQKSFNDEDSEDDAEEARLAKSVSGEDEPSDPPDQCIDGTNIKASDDHIIRNCFEKFDSYASNDELPFT
ncbi:hypothetical protein IFR05_014104 [Cadophora sp. M221]|nr:hypothetical protein IFR05_014104 [Cadophora sp. M221]